MGNLVRTACHLVRGSTGSLKSTHSQMAPHFVQLLLRDSCKWLHTHRTSVTSLDNHLNVNVEQGSHRPQTLPQCCHLESFYFKHRSFSCHYICKDIMCKHVINIQHALCSVVANRPWLQQVVLSILHAKPKAVCKPRCLSLAATSSSLSLCANMTSSIKAKIRNISLCCQRRTEPWP